VIDSIYRTYYQTIQHLVISNSGTVEDAKDIFQESLMAIFDRIHERKFVLTCQFGTFLYAISRNLWLRQLRQKNVHFIDIHTAANMDILLMANDEVDEVTHLNDRYQLYVRKFEEIGEQ